MSEQVKPASEQKPFGYLCDWGNDSYGLQRVAFYYGEPGSATEDDWNEFPKVHNNLALYLAPQPDYKAQRDALLDFANHIATAPQLSGTGWQEMAQMVVASVKGGAT